MVMDHWRTCARCAAALSMLGIGLFAQDAVEAESTDAIEPTQYSVAAPPAPVPQPAAKPTPKPQPFKPMFFDNDFRYKQKPDHAYIFGEELKDIPLDSFYGCGLFEDTTLSTGGELRFRYLNEDNRLRPGGPGQTDYDQWRWRHYVDVKHCDYLRAYVELIDGSTNHADLPLVGIDKNRWDLQNYFVDLALPSPLEETVWLRVGRQELFYGNQRLVSPLDWSNIRRNFEGLKVFTKQETWDLDLWLVNPVNTATPNAGVLAVNDNSFDQRNEDYLFGGAYGTYKGIENHTIDLFLLYANLNVPVTGFPFGDRYTLGARWLGNYPTDCGDRIWHGEIETGYQFGNDRSAFYDAASPRASVQAGYFTAGGGHTWKSVPWQPNFWLYYDWASGDRDPTDGENNTFFQHFGLVHAYFGLIDNLARQNIQDLNYRFTVKPTDKLQLVFAQHWFRLDTASDVLYNITGTPVGTPGNGTDVGQELDLVATYAVNTNWSFEAGYFWFWYGDYIGNVSPRDTAEQFYVMSTLRY
jgi:hypothetical protein